MATSDDIQDAIDAAAVKPKRVKTPTAEVENPSLTEMIEAQKHKAAQESVASNSFFGLRVKKARFGRRGSSEDC